MPYIDIVRISGNPRGDLRFTHGPTSVCRPVTAAWLSLSTSRRTSLQNQAIERRMGTLEPLKRTSRSGSFKTYLVRRVPQCLWPDSQPPRTPDDNICFGISWRIQPLSDA